MSAVWPHGYGRIEFDEIDSTNEEARRQARAGTCVPLWIRADRQTMGRGRRGRSWSSGDGNLAATLLMRPQCSIAQCAQLSFVTAVAAAQAVRSFTAQVEVKWPNDILVRSRKIAGILLETAGTGTPDYLAIGVGINLANHPGESLFPATSLAALGVAVPSAGEMLSELAASFARWYEVWRDDGFGSIRSEWLKQAARLGEPIRARLAESEMSGVFEGIDENGALLLRQEQLTVTIAAADVYFGS